MTTLQKQVMQRISNLSDDNLQFLLEMIDRFMQSNDAEEKAADVSTQRIGIAKGEDLYDDAYDFDELNQEIAKMFGVI